jgi:hypothetical protein
MSSVALSPVVIGSRFTLTRLRTMMLCRKLVLSMVTAASAPYSTNDKKGCPKSLDFGVDF